MDFSFESDISWLVFLNFTIFLLKLVVDPDPDRLKGIYSECKSFPIHNTALDCMHLQYAPRDKTSQGINEAHYLTCAAYYCTVPNPICQEIPLATTSPRDNATRNNISTLSETILCTDHIYIYIYI